VSRSREGRSRGSLGHAVAEGGDQLQEGLLQVRGVQPPLGVEEAVAAAGGRLPGDLLGEVHRQVPPNGGDGTAGVVEARGERHQVARHLVVGGVLGDVGGHAEPVPRLGPPGDDDGGALDPGEEGLQQPREGEVADDAEAEEGAVVGEGEGEVVGDERQADREDPDGDLEPGHPVVRRELRLRLHDLGELVVEGELHALAVIGVDLRDRERRRRHGKGAPKKPETR